MAITLSIPATVRMTKKQKCPIKSLDTGNFTLRNSFSPLATISIDGELSQSELESLVSQIETARGVTEVKLPWVSSKENYLIQAYKIVPIVLGYISKIEFTMVQKRSGLVFVDTSFYEIKYPVIYDSSFQDVYFRNFQKQFGSGIQFTEKKGSRDTKTEVWSVAFQLTLAQSIEIDNKLTGRRGIHPFKWHHLNQATDTDSWTCGEWSIEYFARDLMIFTGQFVYDGRPVKDNVMISEPPINCDALYDSVAALLPLNIQSGFQDIARNHYTFGISATINSTELDPFGMPGVAAFNGTQAFRIDASYDLRLNGIFSIELYIKPTTLSPPPDPYLGGISSTFLEFRNDSQNSQPMNFYFLPNGSIGAGWLSPSSPNTISAPGKILVNEWNYINISRDINNTFTIDVNEEKVIEQINLSGNLASNIIDWYIGGFKPSPPFGFSGLIGFMAWLRFTIGAVRDGLNKPTRNFANDKCLVLRDCEQAWFPLVGLWPLDTLHTFNDVSRYSTILTVVNSQIVDTATLGTPVDPFANNSGIAKINANGYLKIDGNSYFNNNNTELSFWFYPITHPGLKWGLATIKIVNNNAAFDIEVNNDGSIEFRSAITITSAPNLIRLNRWNFFRFRRGYVTNSNNGQSDSRCQIQINNAKVLQFDRPDAINGEVFNWGNGVFVGKSSDPALPGINGYLSDLRISAETSTGNLAPIQKSPTVGCIVFTPD
jgi:phage-related protein